MSRAVSVGLVVACVSLFATIGIGKSGSLWQSLDPSTVTGGDVTCYVSRTPTGICLGGTKGCTTVDAPCVAVGDVCPIGNISVRNHGNYAAGCDKSEGGNYDCTSSSFFCYVTQTCESCIDAGSGKFHCSVMGSNNRDPENDFSASGATCP